MIIKFLTENKDLSELFDSYLQNNLSLNNYKSIKYNKKIEKCKNIYLNYTKNYLNNNDLLYDDIIFIEHLNIRYIIGKIFSIVISNSINVKIFYNCIFLVMKYINSIDDKNKIKCCNYLFNVAVNCLTIILKAETSLDINIEDISIESNNFKYSNIEFDILKAINFKLINKDKLSKYIYYC